MACRKYTLTNTTSSNGVFSYQECSNLMWNYDILIEPNTTLNVWLITGTFSTATSSIITVDDLGNFPFVVPPTPSVSGTGNVTPTPTPTPSITPSISPSSETPTPTPTETEQITPSSTETPTPTPTETEQITPSSTETPTPTPTLTSGVSGNFEVNMIESGSDVVLSFAGSLDLTGLDYVQNQTSSSGGVGPQAAAFGIGPTETVDRALYTGSTFSYPANFGPGGAGPGSVSGSGDYFGVFSGILPTNCLVVPTGYTSSTFISGTTTLSSSSFLSLGMTPGSYNYSWGVGPGQSFILTIGPISPTPSPTSTETPTPTPSS